MGWFGLGRPRSRFGKWLEVHSLTQEEFADECGISSETVSRLAKDESRVPSWKVQKKIMDAARRYDDGISARDFWG